MLGSWMFIRTLSFPSEMATVTLEKQTVVPGGRFSWIFTNCPSPAAAQETQSPPGCLPQK